MATSGDWPRGTERRVPLPGARVLSVRPVGAGDAGGLAALFRSLPADDLYRRFFSGQAPPDAFIAQMTAVAQRGGFGLVASIEEAGAASRMVAEASYELLPDGDGELGITVAEHARGWLGPFLLDVLVEEAAARGVPNLQAEVLVTNGRMLAMLYARGLVVLDRDEQPAVVRVAIGTTRSGPSWPGPRDRPRLLLEVPGGRWHAEDAARAAGFQVLACPGPLRGWSRCPALRGEPCPLAIGADVIVDALAEGAGRSLLEAHRRVHPSVPVCVELPPGAEEAGTDAVRLPRGAEGAVVVGVLQRLAKVAHDRPTGEQG